MTTKQYDVDEDEISLADLYSALVKSKKLIIALVLIGGLLGGGLTLLLNPRTYESSCLMRLGVVLDRPIEPMDRLMEILKEPNTIMEIAKRLGFDIQKQDVIEHFKKNLIYSNRAGLLEIKARAKNAKKTVLFVNTVAQLVLERHAVFFQRYQQLYKSQLNDILNVYKQNPLNVDARTLPLITEPTELIVPSYEPNLPLRRGTMKNVFVGFVIGTFVSIVWLFLRKGFKVVSSVQ